MLFIDEKGSSLKINAVPGKAEYFSLTKPGKNCNLIQKLMSDALNFPEKKGKLLVFIWIYFRLFDSRQRVVAEDGFVRRYPRATA